MTDIELDDDIAKGYANGEYDINQAMAAQHIRTQERIESKQDKILQFLASQVKKEQAAKSGLNVVARPRKKSRPATE